ncbi:MAG: Stp1/IreP family PP2C-type Ser/Thr phosphatase [Actinomycetota bacterium]|nr:Stp1/IreP family PP2C-type Ser/Thr phosphatase [Actinomycetota bacterium]
MISFGAKSDIGMVREVNEDAYIAGGNLFAVADGMGGHKGGEIASKLALISIAKSLKMEGDPKKNLLSTMRRANRGIYQRSIVSPELKGMGTTLTVLLISNRAAHIGHIGDSRAYLARGGELVQLTQDHSLVAQMVAEGKLTSREAHLHPLRSVITRSLGASAMADPDVFTLKLKDGDRLLLASDGLNSMLSDAEILEIVGKKEEPQAVCEELVSAANRQGGRDNVTVVLVEYLEEEGLTFDTLTTKKNSVPLPQMNPGCFVAFFLVITLILASLSSLKEALS